MAPRRSQTFIGSSSEGIAIANAIMANLADVTDCRVWTEGVFLPGSTFIETLEKLLGEVDYAVLVATPDDMLIKRDVESHTMRDNVLLELGLFMARLGRKRTYLVTPRDEPLHIPSDLLGVTTVTYTSLRKEDQTTWIKAMAEPCASILLAMADAEKALSMAMKREMVRRLLEWTTKLHGLLASLQSDSVKSLLDRKKFEKLRQDMIARVADLELTHREDAERLGVVAPYGELGAAMTDAVKTLPFPEEAVVSQSEMVSGILGAAFGGAGLQEQVQRRLNSLLTRYDEWWSKCSLQITRSMLGFQAALIEKL